MARNVEHSPANAARASADGVATANAHGVARARADDGAAGRKAVVLDSIGDAIARFDRNWRYVYMNERMQAITGASLEQRLGKVFWDLFPELVGTEIERRYRRAMDEQRTDQLELYFPPWDRWLESRLYPSDGGLTVFLSDLTPRVQAQQALGETQHLMHLLVDSVTEHEICMLDANGCIRSWNPAAQRSTGYPAEEIIGQPLGRLYTEEDCAAGEPERELRIAASDGKYRGEGWRVRSDGSRFWASMVIDAVRDARGELVGFAQVTRDLSDRRKLDVVREYAQRQQQALEEERRRIARSLHDDLGHRLAVMAMDVAEAMRTPLAPQTRTLLANVRAMITESADTMRRILADLRPPELDELGLQAAIESFVARWSVRYEVAGAVSVAGDLECCAQPVQSAVYSLVQEALNNVAKHARATTATVTLAHDGETLRLEVRDDGVGLTDAEQHRSGRFGLLGMAERVRLLDGSFRIQSAPGQGTTLTVTLPLAGSPRSTQAV